MALSIEALIAIIALVIALPPSLLILGKILRRPRHSRLHNDDMASRERVSESPEQVSDGLRLADSRQLSMAPSPYSRLLWRQAVYAVELEMALELGHR